MANHYNFNFRATAGSWGEVAPSGFVNGNLYPSTIAGVTCGFAIAPTVEDYTSATNAKISGRNYFNNTTNYFKVDCPEGAGKYKVWIGLSANKTTASTAAIITDGSGNTLLTLPATSVPTGSIMDATGTVLTATNYLNAGGGTYVELTTNTGVLQISRNNTAAVTVQLVNLQIEKVDQTLSDSTLTNKFGVGTISSIYPNNPIGMKIGKVTAPNGLQNFSVIGTSANYFSIQTINSENWLVTSGSRVPNTFTGPIIIRQTSDTQTRDTSFPITVLPNTVTNYFADTKYSTELLVKKSEIETKIDTESWTGYTNQSFAQDILITSSSQFVTTLNNIVPDGSSWYRFRIGAGGNWTTNSYLNLDTSGKDFGNGGLLIEPNLNEKVKIKTEFRNFRVAKCHIRNLWFEPIDTGYNLVGYVTPTAPFNNIIVENCNIGTAHDPAWGGTTTFQSWGSFGNFGFVKQYTFKNNRVFGVRNGNTVSGGRIFDFTNNEYKYVISDYHALTTAYDFDTPRGVFADDITYCRVNNNSARCNPDNYNLETPHGDWFQNRRTGGLAYPAAVHPKDNVNAYWQVGYYVLNLADNKVYVVTNAGTGLGDTVAPTGTGTGIVWGGVTLDYYKHYGLATRFRVSMNNNCILSDGVSYYNGSTIVGPNIQFCINSNDGFGNVLEFIATNNICASSNTRGIYADDSEIYAEYNTFIGPSQRPIINGTALNVDPPRIQGTITHARRNILGINTTTSLPFVVGSTSTYDDFNLGINFDSGSASSNAPGNHLKGQFSIIDGQNAWGYTPKRLPSYSKDEFIDSMSKTLHHTTGSYGAKLTELYNITVSDGTNSFNRTIKIKPRDN